MITFTSAIKDQDGYYTYHVLLDPISGLTKKFKYSPFVPTSIITTESQYLSFIEAEIITVSRSLLANWQASGQPIPWTPGVTSTSNLPSQGKSF